MSVTYQPMTADELFVMPQDNQRCELVKGELRTMAPAGFEHGDITMRLSWRLAQYIESHELGAALTAETGFKLASSPDTVRAPDFAFIYRDRVPAGGFKKFFNGPPDLAVEVVSPSDTAEEVDEKVLAWLHAGTVAVWVVNPNLRTVTEYRSPKSIRVWTIDDELSIDDLLPGFRCHVADVFAKG